jgi:isoquinoline 1-oxidoreductase beta subunit
MTGTKFGCGIAQCGACTVHIDVEPTRSCVTPASAVGGQAVDCGTVVNPDTIRAQLEGGLVLGLGTALYNQITVTGLAVEQGNFDTYRALRINEAPDATVRRPVEAGLSGAPAAPLPVAPPLSRPLLSRRLRRAASLPG